MTTFKIAYLYITRKKVRSIIMFMLLTIISTVLLSSNILNHTVKGISNKIYESSNFGFTVKNLSKTDKEISVKKLDKITNLPDIKGANYQFATPVNLLGSKVVEGQNNLILDEKTNKNNLVMLNANTNTADNSDFKSEVLKLKKGRHIGPEDRNKVLVHEEFAKLNNLDIGSKIKLEKANSSEQKTTNKDYEVVGIYSGTKNNEFQGLSSDFIENTVYTDYKSSQELMGYSESDKKVTSVDYFVKNPEKLEDVVKSAENLAIEDTEIVKSNKNFQTVIASLQSIEKIIDMVKIGSIIASVIILSLVLIFWLRERLHEIGILLSIGTSKTKIILQQIIELVYIAVFSIILSSVLENVILKYGVKNAVDKIGVDNLPEAIFQQILNVKVELGYVLTVSAILFLIIVCSIVITSLITLRMKPKEILSKMS